MREAKDEAVREDARNALTYREAVHAIRALVDDEALDGHRVRRQLYRFQAQPGGARGVLARAGEQPAVRPP